MKTLRPGRRAVFAVLLSVLSLLLLSSSIHLTADASAPMVSVIRAAGTVNPVMAEWIRESLAKAEADGSEALVVELDTPGGLDSSMRVIIKDIVGSPVPVVVFVSPTGARAASAGVFLAMAAHVAAMAPGTNIGAAHPVSMGGKMDDTMTQKVTNDAAAYIRSLAVQRGRNADWAERAVRESVSLGAVDAVRENVVDVLAKDIADLVVEIDGRTVETALGKRTLATTGASTVQHEMPGRLRILSYLADPNIAYIFLLLGIYGIFFEIMNPGAVFPGVLGAIALLIALYSLQTLPVNYAGVLFIVLGVILFILEIKVTSYGLLSLGGIICLIVGSLMLFRSAGPFYRLSLFVLVPSVAFTAGLFITTVFLVVRAQRARVRTGVEGLMGVEGVALEDFSGGSGHVRVHGEIWAADSSDTVGKGDRVIVISVFGLMLSVKRKEQQI